MDALAIIGERRIREAIARGELDGLPGRGRPLELEDVSGIPDELRLGYLALRTTGWARRGLGARASDLTLHDLLGCVDDACPAERRRKLSAARYRFERHVASRGANAALDDYATRILDRLSGA